MTPKRAIKNVMKTLGITQTKLAELCEYGSQSAIAMILGKTRKSFYADNFIRMVNAMDCEVVIRCKSDPLLEWVVDEEDGKK